MPREIKEKNSFFTLVIEKWRSFIDSDLVYSFYKSKISVVSAIIVFVILFSSIFAPIIAPHTPFDVSTVSLKNSEIPPAWMEGGDSTYILGTDTQGRDMFSAILYGARISIFVSFVSIFIAMVVGVAAGLLSGYLGGPLDAFIMRIADVMISFPSLLIALLISGVARAVLPSDVQQYAAIYVLIFSIAFTRWVHFARPVRGSTMVEKNKEYTLAARVIGLHPIVIMVRHVMRNVMNPVFVIATINLGNAILIEATLSFLGVGMPPTQPSMGTLIRIGNEYLFSGFWWIVIFPALVLALLVLSVNLLGDWLRDALNPKLR